MLTSNDRTDPKKCLENYRDPLDKQNHLWYNKDVPVRNKKI